MIVLGYIVLSLFALAIFAGPPVIARLDKRAQRKDREAWDRVARIKDWTP
jgi:hypothetical protein